MQYVYERSRNIHNQSYMMILWCPTNAPHQHSLDSQLIQPA